MKFQAYTLTSAASSQVIRELKRTRYRPKTAVLVGTRLAVPFLDHSVSVTPAVLRQASREQYCVNKAVTSKPSISEECDRLLGGDGLSCSYHSNFNRLLGSSLADKLKVSLWCCAP